MPRLRKSGIKFVENGPNVPHKQLVILDTIPKTPTFLAEYGPFTRQLTAYPQERMQFNN